MRKKLEVSKPKSWLKAVSAFSNGIGGKIIFGISDDNIITGLNDYKKDSEAISEFVKTRMDPISKVNMYFEVINNKYLIVLEVIEGNETPYYYVDGSNRIA